MKICQWSAFAEKKNFSWGKRKGNIQIAGESYWKLKLVSLFIYLIKNNVMIRLINSPYEVNIGEMNITTI